MSSAFGFKQPRAQRETTAKNRRPNFAVGARSAKKGRLQR
jgi:hypothetical protein